MGAMESAFLPPDAALLARQAALYRRLAAVARNPESAARLNALADDCAAEAARLADKDKS